MELTAQHHAVERPSRYQPTRKSVTCTICQKKFSRTDHLKRHNLRHSGVKPYSCVFCSDPFTRSDNLRDHYPECPQRMNRPIPEATRGGRRSHACDSCTSMKLGCNGNTPCNTCSQKGLDCKFSRLQSKGTPAKNDTSKPPQDKDPSSDRGSIKFLLNSGTASFVECFRFPSENERRNLFNFRNTRAGSIDSNIRDFFGNASENGSTFSDPFEDEPIDWSLFEDENLLRFLSSPFTDMQMQSDDMFAPLYMDSNYVGSTQMKPLSFPTEWEPASVQSSAIVQLIVEKAVSLQLNSQEQADIQHHLNFLFTPSKITKFVNLYFEFWHPHCPIVHQPTFNIDTAPIPMLLAVTVMGSMYSQADREVNTAKILLDLAELVIYSVDDLTDEFEIKQMLRGSIATTESVTSSPMALAHLQAAYLMVVVQFWAGSMVSRKRAVETRFNIVVKIARRLGLTKTRHELDDSIDESLWIQKESQIRLINTMTLLDCAFSFFANFPCRLTLSEMRFDLPCEDIYFSSLHPFSERSFMFSRRITLNEAFHSLFLHKPTMPTSNPIKKNNPLGLNPMDMFILIHILYVYTLTHITLFSSSIPHLNSPSTPDQSGASTPAGGPPPSGPPSDSNLTLIKAALSRWRSLWTAIRSNMPNHAWANLGFFRNGYNYWLVTQLLINTKGSAELMMNMEVGCEDTLKQLKGLLREGLGEVAEA